MKYRTNTGYITAMKWFSGYTIYTMRVKTQFCIH